MTYTTSTASSDQGDRIVWSSEAQSRIRAQQATVRYTTIDPWQIGTYIDSWNTSYQTIYISELEYRNDNIRIPQGEGLLAQILDYGTNSEPVEVKPIKSFLKEITLI